MKNIVLLHGWGANSKKLESLAQNLRVKKWKVLVPQLPGFNAPEPDSEWSLNEYAKFVSDFAKKAFGSENYFVFGHSFGGGVAIKMASNAQNEIEGLVLCAGRGISRGNKIKRGIFYVLSKMGKALLFVLPLAHLWRKLIYKLAREHDYEKASPRMKGVFKKVVEEDLKPQISKIKAPSLILWGKLDKITPIADALYLKENLTTSELVTYEDQGHRLPYEKPQEIAEEIEKWITKL